VYPTALGVTIEEMLAAADGWLSIEHEEVPLNSLQGLEKSAAVLQAVMPAAPADYKPQAI
jgi:hypothetical protein